MSGVLFGMFVGLGAGYLLMSWGVAWGIRRVRRRTVRRPEPSLPRVSILVAARNEEARIESCLRSLLAQDYPTDRLEVILIDDRSTDRTGAIAKALAGEDPRLRVVRVDQEPRGWTGKHQALHLGVQHSSGEVLLTTDADGWAPKAWVRTMVGQMDPSVGLVFGPSVMDRPGSSLWERVQSLEMLTLVGSAAAAVVWGFPSACSGHNLAIRRKALEEIGGYPALGFTLTEDTALIRALVRRTRWQVRPVLDPDVLLRTEPIPDWRGLIQQRRRWLLGGRAERVPAMQFLRFIFAYHLGLWAMLVLAPFLGGGWTAWAVMAVAKGLGDFSVSVAAARAVRRGDLIRVFPAYYLYHLLYTTILGLSVLRTRRIEWKGQEFSAEVLRRAGREDPYGMDERRVRG